MTLKSPSIGKKMHAFNKRWNINFNEKERWEVFKRRIINSYSSILARKIYESVPLKEDFFHLLGMNENKASQGPTFSGFRHDCPVFFHIELAKDQYFIRDLQIIFWLKNLQ